MSLFTDEMGQKMLIGAVVMQILGRSGDSQDRQHQGLTRSLGFYDLAMNISCWLKSSRSNACCRLALFGAVAAGVWWLLE